MVKSKRAKPRINTGEIVLSALKKLMKNTGWTTRTIVKFIKAEYNISDRNLGRKVSRALKNCNRRGLIKNESGRYRLCHASGVVKCKSSSEMGPRSRTRRPCHLRRRIARRRGRPNRRSLQIRSRSRT